MQHELTLRTIREAGERIRGRVVRTPLLRYALDARAELLLKPENLQPTGACALALARREARGRCGVLLSGGNADPALLAEVAARGARA
jgi:threonine dehydratase